MTEQELIQQLNSLKQIKLDSSWKKKTRNILLFQAANTVARNIKVNPFEHVFHDLKKTFSFLPQTAWAAVCLVVIFTGGTYSAYAAKNSLPGDHFYALKVWKEKVQLAMIFNQEEKAKLDMKFASTHAREISEVLADPDFSRKGSEKKAEELAQNFNKQISIVKNRLSEIKEIQEKKQEKKTMAAISEENNELASSIELDDNVKVGIGDLTKDNDGKVYSVEAGKEGQGVQIYDPNADKDIPLNKLKVSTTTTVASQSPVASSSIAGSSTEEEFIIPASASSTDVSEEINNTLDLAAESFATKDFAGAKNILKQVGVIIENIGSIQDSGQTKGDTEAGTSTQTSGFSAETGSSSEK